MPALFMEASLFTLDLEPYEKFLKKWQTQIMRAAVRAFLKGTLSRIPRRTGFLRGAFNDVRAEFGKDSASGMGPNSGDGAMALAATIFGGARRRVTSQGDDPIEREKRIQALMKKHSRQAKKGRANKRDRNFGKGNEKYTEVYERGKVKVLKTPNGGVKYATKPADVLKFSGNVATFFFDVSISYYRINDNFARIRGAPWHSLMEGGSAMTNWLGRAADQFPNITEILVRQKIGLRGTRLTQTKLPTQQVASRLLSIKGDNLTEGPIPSGPPPAPPPPPNAKRDFQKAQLLANREAKRKATEKERWPMPAHKSDAKKKK